MTASRVPTRVPYSGYLMTFTGADAPLTGPDDGWELDIGSIPVGSERIGHRRIDGTRFAVFTTTTPGGERVAVVAVIGDGLL